MRSIDVRVEPTVRLVTGAKWYELLTDFPSGLAFRLFDGFIDLAACIQILLARRTVRRLDQ
jgi:hypothetical protein